MVAHHNLFGVDSVSSGKVREITKEVFRDTHGSQGTNWLDTTTTFFLVAYAAVVAESGVLRNILLKITTPCLIDTQLN